MRLMRLPTLLGSSLLALLLAACGAAQTSTVPTPASVSAGGAAAPTADAMAGMDHSTPMTGMGSSDAPYDAQFIANMTVHHEGAIVMARQALTQAERPEIKDLANAIITAQEGEIAQMKAWRAAWYPELAATPATTMEMGPMEVPAGDAPFDQRFIQAMIPHHQSAIMMAQDALQNAERQEIKDLATGINTAQEGEIAQMRQWLKDWYSISQ